MAKLGNIPKSYSGSLYDLKNISSLSHIALSGKTLSEPPAMQRDLGVQTPNPTNPTDGALTRASRTQAMTTGRSTIHTVGPQYGAQSEIPLNDRLYTKQGPMCFKPDLNKEEESKGPLLRTDEMRVAKKRRLSKQT